MDKVWSGVDSKCMICESNENLIYSEVAEGQLTVQDIIQKYDPDSDEENHRINTPESLTEKFLNKARGIAKGVKVDGVSNVQDIIIHTYGAQKFISLHLEIDEDKSSEKMHDIADQVEKKLSTEMAKDVAG